MDMNKEVTQEMKATQWRILRLVVNNGIRTRPVMGKASMVVAKASSSAWMKDLGFWTLSP